MNNDTAFKEMMKKMNSDPTARVKDGYVIMLDVLGFRDLISKRFGYSFFKIWADIKQKLLERKDELEKKIKPLDIDILCLSDTLVVCLSMKKKTKIDPRILISLIPKLIDSFFWEQFESRVFFRGAISYGKYQCDMDNNIAMGAAIEEAYEWHELADWIGIFLTPSAEYAREKYVLDNKPDDIITLINKRFVPYGVPFKDSKTFETHACIWFTNSKDKTENKSLLSKILTVFSEVKYLQTIAKKYSNTLEFIKKHIEIDDETTK